MEDIEDLRNRNVLSESYMQGVKRITGNRSTNEEEYKTSEDVYEKRQQTWFWLFEKFSKLSDDTELNIRTLRPDTESDSSYSSEVRVPVRKSTAQLQYWLNTGDAPCKAVEKAGSDANETISINESEVEDFDETQSSLSGSMSVNKKLTNSGEHLTATGSSASSVDTATYIKTNANMARKNAKNDPRSSLGHRKSFNNIVGRSINAAVPRVVLYRLTDIHKRSEICENILTQGKNISADIDEEGNKRSEITDRDEIVSDKNIGEKTKESLEKESKNNAIKESEITFESRESGIGSLAVESVETGHKTDSKQSSDSSVDVFPVLSQSSIRRKRKLFTNDGSLFDLFTPVVQTTVRRISSCVRQSLHPALESPSTFVRKQTASRPRLSTMAGGRIRKWNSSKFRSNNKRNKNKSLLSESRVFKNSLLACNDKPKPAGSVESEICLGNRSPNHSVPVDTDGTERSKEVASQVERTSPKVPLPSPNTGKEKSPESKNTNDDTSSLSANDVSQIINEELNQIPNTRVVNSSGKNQPRHLPVVDDQRSEKNDSENDQGSIFKPAADSSSETKESRRRNMLHIKRNLCATDLMSSGDTDSPLNSNSETATKCDEDNISNASTILLSHLKKRGKSRKSSRNNSVILEELKSSVELNPKLISHDSLNLKNCFVRLERYTCENLLRKQNEKENLPNDDNNRVGEKSPEIENTVGKMSENVKSMKEKNQSVPVRKKIKLDKKLTTSKRGQKILFTTHLDCFTDDSISLEEKQSYSRIAKPKDDFNHHPTINSNFLKEIQPIDKSKKGENSTITFTNNNCDEWKSIFATSSEDEDIFKILSIPPKRRSSRIKNTENDEKAEASINATKNTTLNDRGGTKSPKTLKNCYKMVSSSSEEEEKAVEKVSPITRVLRMTRKYSKRNKRKDSMESELTMCSSEDECRDRSEGFQTQNEKLEKQSLRVNRCSYTKKGKQSRETLRDYPVPQSDVNSKILNDRKLRLDRVCKNSNKSEDVIPHGETNDVDKVVEPKKNDDENDLNMISENLNIPVDRGIRKSLRIQVQDISENDLKDKNLTRENVLDIKKREKSNKSLTRMKKNILRKIARAAESSESEAASEVGRLPNSEDISESSLRIAESESGLKSNKKETRTKSRSFLFFSDNESFNNDDEMIFCSNNYAGGNTIWGKNNLNKDKVSSSSIINSYKHSSSPNKRDIKTKKDASSSSKKKITNRRTNSKIVFRTKEYWESDSNNS